MAAVSNERRRWRGHHWIYTLLWFIVVLLAEVATVTAASPQIPELNSVLQLTEQTFATATQSYDPLFVLFDSPSRYGSVTLSRRFVDAAQAVRLSSWTTRDTLRFATLDVSQITHSLPYELQVLGLPALLRFHCFPVDAFPPKNTSFSPGNVTLSTETCSTANGGIEVYTGGRTSMEFQRYVLGQPRREVVQLDTQQQLDAVVKTRLFVALFVVDGVDSQAFFDCRVLAQIDADTSTYVATTNEQLAQQDQEEGGGSSALPVPALVIYREFGEQRVVYSGDWNKGALSLFIQKNRYNLLSTYTSTDASYFYDRAAEAHVLLFSDPLEKYHGRLLAETQEIAYQYYAAANNPGNHVLRFVVVPKQEKTLKNALFVSDDQFPTVLIVRDVSQAAIRMPFFGESMVSMLMDDGSFAQSLADELESVFAPFDTSDLPDDPLSEASSDWRDYSDLFENRDALLVVAPPPPQATLISTTTPLRGGRRLSGESDGEVRLFGSERDAFLSIFASPQTAPTLAPSVITIVSLKQLEDQWHHGRPGRILALLHSTRCYPCRQAKSAMEALAQGTPDVFRDAQIGAIAVVDVDQVDVRGWPLHVDSLPGIFLLAAPNQVVPFPSRTAVTIESLSNFFRTMSQI